MTQIKEEYEKLKKEFGLPDFEKLNKEFEICALDLDNCGILMNALLRVIATKLSLFLNYLEPVVSPPSQSLHSIIETRNIDDETKKEIFDFYRELGFMIHESFEFELKSEKEIAEHIKKIFKEWPKIKEKELKYLNIIKQSWTKEEQEEENNSYTG